MLGRNPEKAFDKLRLTYRVSPVQSFDLTLPHHVHSLDPLQRLLCCME